MRKNGFIISVCLFLYITTIQAQNSTTNLLVNSSLFQSMTARNLGPSTMSGRVTSIVGTTIDNQVNLYVGTAGGGIWKSMNGGISFAPIFDKYCQSIGAMAIDPNASKVIYAGTGESNMRNSVSIGDGLYKSTDAGSNWQKIGLDSTEHISKIIVDPSNSKNIFVSVPGPLWSSSKHRGLYHTNDGGKTWDKILFIDEETGCADIAMSPTNSNILLASFWKFRRQAFSFNSGGSTSALYKSVDGGKTWKKIETGLPDGDKGRIVVTINPSKPKEVLAIIEAKVPGLYQSQDEGETWTKLASTDNITARPFYFSTLEFDPKDPKRVYRPAFDFQYSVDGGYAWSNTVIGDVIPHADHHALWINPNNTNSLYLGTDGGVYVSHNKGISWSFLNNLPVGQFYHVSVSNEKAYNVYGGLQDNGSWMAPSSSPGGVSSTDWKFLNGGDGFWVQPSPLNSNIAYAESQGGEINRINLANGLSYGIKPQRNSGEDLHRWNWNTPIVVAKSTKRAGGYNLYTANQYLYKSTDEGDNWTKISPDLTTNDKNKQNTEKSGGITGDNTSAENHCTIFTMTQDPRNEDVIWVGTDDGNLQYTNNGGKNWINLSANIWAAGIPKYAWISSIELSSKNPQRVYVTLDNHTYGDHATYVVVSNDAGKTWKRFQSKEFTGFAHVIREDLEQENLLFLGTEMGLFISVDAGVNWMRSKYQNIPWYALVRDLKVVPQTGDLAIATHGRGIYLLDNLASLRRLIQSDLTKDILFQPVANFKYDFAPQVPFEDGNIAGWVAGNKVNLPTFEYYLKQRSEQAVKIVIYDEKNNKIKDINASTNKGLNRVYWGFDQNPCKVALGGFTAGSSVLFSSVLGPKVKTGKYKAVLEVGNQKFEQFFNIEPNIEKGFTANKINLLNEQSMRLFRVHEKLAILVDSLDKFIHQLEKIEHPTTNQIAKLNALNNFKSEIIETKRKTVFFDEFKFRRRLSDVYFSLITGIEPYSASRIGAIQVLESEFGNIEKQFQELIN